MKMTESQKLLAEMREQLTQHGLEHNTDNKLAYLEGLRESLLETKYSTVADDYLIAIEAEITLLSLKLILNHTRTIL
jgi:galactose mutarotase-like enzyme